LRILPIPTLGDRHPIKPMPARAEANRGKAAGMGIGATEDKLVSTPMFLDKLSRWRPVCMPVGVGRLGQLDRKAGRVTKGGVEEGDMRNLTLRLYRRNCWGGDGGFC